MNTPSDAKKIIIEKESDFIINFGMFALSQERESNTKSWRTLASELEIYSSDPASDIEYKLKHAWMSFIYRGVTTNKGLHETLAFSSNLIKKDYPTFKPIPLSNEVVSAFNQMYAFDRHTHEKNIKNQSDLAPHSKSLGLKLIQFISPVQNRILISYLSTLFIIFCLVLFSPNDGSNEPYLIFKLSAFAGVMCLPLIITLTIIHWIFTGGAKLWRVSKIFRVFSFISLLWIAFTTVLIFVFDPFYISDDEIITLTTILFPPLFSGFSYWAYQKFIK